MSTISIVKKSPNAIHFKINNKKDIFDIALINGIRRVIIANLEIYCFSRESVVFQYNSSIYNEDFLSQRFSLIPLNFRELEKMELDKIEAYLFASNDDPIDFVKVFASDLKIYYGDRDTDVSTRKLLDNSKIITHPGILLLELKPGQKVSVTMNMMMGTHKEDGSMFSPVSKSIYYFEEDGKALEVALKSVEDDKKEDFRLLNGEKYYLKNASGTPAIYNFLLETDNIFPINEIFERGCNKLKAILESMINEIKNIEASTIVAMETSPTNMVGYDFVFEKSDSTLGNLIQTYGLKEKDIHYLGYNIPHPLDRRLYVRMSLEKENATRGDYEKKIITILVKIVEILDELKKSYLSALK